MSKPILGYWDIRGLAQPIRYLLAYASVDYEDKRYTERPAWLNEKFNLGLDFPNLPYYMDGDVKLSQSLAILRYLARKYDLNAKTEEERIRVSLCEQQTMDLMMALGRICYNPSMEQLRPEYIAALPDQFELLSKFMGNNAFVAGADLTYVDFLLFEYLVKIKHFVPEVYEKHENLKTYVKRMEELPKLSSYIKQQQPKPFNGAPALWNITA